MVSKEFRRIHLIAKVYPLSGLLVAKVKFCALFKLVRLFNLKKSRVSKEARDIYLPGA